MLGPSKVISVVTEVVSPMFSVKNLLYKSFGKFRVKHLCHSLFFNELAGLEKTNTFYPLLWVLSTVVFL